MTGVTSGAGTAYAPASPESVQTFYSGWCFKSLVFCVVFCKSSFVFLQLYCLSVDLRLLITPLAS